ncbi:MAG: sodium:solute symporter family protein, partial [Pseudomonadota bacterium]
MSSFAIGLIISILIYLTIGYIAGRRVKHLEDFYVAGRNAPTMLIVGTLVASFLSTNAFMGEVGMSYQGHGALILLLVAINSLGYILGALFFGRYLRRSKALTVPEFFGTRFASKRIQMATGITVVIGLAAYMLAVTLGLAILVTQVSGLSYPVAVILVWLGYTLFTLYSGSEGVILTDTIMFMLFVSVAVMAAFFIVDATGGMHLAIESLALFENKPDILSWHGMVGPHTNWETTTDAIIWSFILGSAWGIVVAVSPWQASRYLMARDEHTVLRSACGACIAVILMYLVTIFGAAAVNLVNPDIVPAESVMIWTAMNLMPDIAGVILVSGIMAAGLSSASTFLSLVGFSVS